MKIFKYILVLFLSLIFLAYSLYFSYFFLSDLLNTSDQPLFESIYAESKEKHDITLIDSGLQSLKSRIELIRSAKESIELEFFIYELDNASKIITQELIKKANEGVKIRLLVDFSQPVFKLQPFYAYYLKQNNIQVKYYNTSSFFRLFSVQHRSHRKLLIIDGIKALTGGRNIGDDYFDLSQHYNFLDSDILIEGEIVKIIKKSFNLYWNSSYAMFPEFENVLEKDQKDKLSFFKSNPSTEAIVNKTLNTEFPYQKFSCHDILFVTDSPGVLIDNRRVFQTISKELQHANKSLLVESPYFVIKSGGYAILEDLSDKNIKIEVLTNSLYSTDAFYTVSALYNTLSSLKKLNINLNIYNGNKPTQPYFDAIVPGSERWGTHAKRAVIDNKTIMLGTYNVDPRSANINSENLIICKNGDELAQAVTQSIQNHMQNSSTLLNNKQVHYDEIIKKADAKQIFFMHITRPITLLFDNLL